MYVGPNPEDSVALQEHFGTAYTMAEYTSKSHSVYLNLAIAATSKLNFNSVLMFNKSMGELEEIAFPDVRNDILEADELVDQDFTFEEMPSYSDLDYSMIQFGFGLDYRLSPGVSYYGGIDYAKLTDDKGYVYGVESGDYFLIRSGISYEF